MGSRQGFSISLPTSESGFHKHVAPTLLLKPKGSSLFSVEYCRIGGQWLAGGYTFASVSGRPRHAGLENCATTIGRANPKIAGSRPCGIHARRRAWGRLTGRQPPHARARALRETNPAANGRGPIPLEIAKNRLRCPCFVLFAFFAVIARHFCPVIFALRETPRRFIFDA